jgi:hypothetical protein
VALTDDLSGAQETLNDLWASVQDQKELARKTGDLDILTVVSMYVDDAQESLERAMELLGTAA